MARKQCGIALALVTVIGTAACHATHQDEMPDLKAGQSIEDIETLEKTHGPRTYYVLKLNRPLPAQQILPEKTLIEVIWTFEDGFERSFPGFLGWDFDRDGRYEMLEVLGPKGQVKNQIFDFDGDGKVDQMSQNGQKNGPAHGVP